MDYGDIKTMVVTVTCPYCGEGIAHGSFRIDTIKDSTFVEFGQCTNKCKQTKWGFQVRYGYIVGEGKDHLNPSFTEEQ